MEPQLDLDSIFRFGAFELDLRAGELRKNGLRVKLQDAPLRALRLFLCQPQQVLSREELRRALWPNDVFVDFNRGINTTINRLREALGDTSTNPIFIETVARSGYRWIAPVQVVASDSKADVSVDTEEISTRQAPPPPPVTFLAHTTNAGRTVIAALLSLILVISLAAGIRSYRLNPRMAAWLGALPISVVTAESRETKKPPDHEAEQLYLLGRYYWNKRTPDDLNRAVNYFNQAIARDPSYTDAYVGLSNCYSLLREFAAMRSEEAFPKALAAARKAVQLDDSSAEAHNALAFVMFYWNWDAPGAEREFRRAIELNPNYVTAHHWYGTFLLSLGRYPEALQEITRAQQLDPTSTPILADKALILFHKGDRAEAIALLQQLSASQPAFFSTHQYLSDMYLYSGDSENFLREAKQAAQLSHNTQQLDVVDEAEDGYRTGGTHGMLLSMLRAQKKYFDEGTLPAFFVAQTYARLGDRDQTLQYLRTSLERHEVALLSARVDEPFAPLWRQPEFEEIVAQTGVTPLK